MALNLGDIDVWRKGHLAVAEFFDAWRFIPRAVVLVYIAGCVYIGLWYLGLEPYILQDCIAAGGMAKDCLIMVPTVSHMGALTAWLGLGTGIFAFYATTGRKWQGNGFSKWNGEKKPEDKTDEAK